jgi:hypothetical protein
MKKQKMSTTFAPKKFNKTIHPNRYFIWAICLLFIAGLALISFIYVTSSQENSSSVFSALAKRKIFINQQQKYTATYPASWQLEKDQSGNTIFENPADSTEAISVSVWSLDVEGIIRHSINIKSERDFTEKDGRQIALIKAISAKDGSLIDAGIVKNSSTLYYISGQSAYFESFVLNLKPF